MKAIYTSTDAQRPEALEAALVSTQPNHAQSEQLSLKPPKRFLYGPGPTQVHPRVYEAMAKPIVGHLDPYFFEISQGVQRGLRSLFGTKNELTLPISATGSGGMETAVSNFVGPGTKVCIFGLFCRSHHRDGQAPRRKHRAAGKALGTIVRHQ